MPENEKLPVQSQDTAIEDFVKKNSLRGTAANISADLSELQRRQMRARMEYPDAYTLGDVLNTTKGYTYQSGMDNGQRYMTVDDFKRLTLDMSRERNTRRTMVSLINEVNTEERINAQKRPASAYRCGECTAPGTFASREPVYCGNTETEYHMNMADRSKTLGELIVGGYRRLKDGAYSVNASLNPKHVSSTIASISIVLVLAFVLVMPVIMSVRIHNARNEISELDSKIAAAEKEAYQLSIKLDEKNDRTMLETLATEKYGMVRIDQRAFSVMRIEDNSVQTIEKEKSGGAVPALLSALGLRSGD